MTTNIKSLSIADQEVIDALSSLPDEVLSHFSFPLFSNAEGRAQSVDEDGFPVLASGSVSDLNELRKKCWEKAESNPQLNSHIRDRMGRMAGWGFQFSSERPHVQRAIEEIMEDPRNDLYQNFPKFIGRKEVEGELFLMVTLHSNGFTEVDFLTPAMIGNGGDKGSGIIHHPTKQLFPLFYLVNFENLGNMTGTDEAESQALIPSINICYYPDLEEVAKKHNDFDEKKLKVARARKPKQHPYNKTNGYQRFIIQWNSGLMTRRNASSVRTTIEWLNYYEALKKYEIDHKKSSGAYLWIVEMEDLNALRNWFGMSEEERKQTGLMQTKDPGGTLILPPGMKARVENPRLPNISDQDTDIMQMVSSGLQKPQDTMLGDYRSTYASVKASQGPQGDRTNDELHYFKLFLVFHFWRGLLYLRSLARDDFKYYRYVREVVRFEKGEPVYGRVKKPVFKFVDISLPVSRLEDVEAFAKAYLGSKHASVVDTLGIPRREVAKRLGFSNYANLRKEKALEDEEYPETLSVENQEAAQEKQESEPPSSSKKKEVEDKKKKKEKEDEE